MKYFGKKEKTKKILLESDYESSFDRVFALGMQNDSDCAYDEKKHQIGNIAEPSVSQIAVDSGKSGNFENMGAQADKVSVAKGINAAVSDNANDMIEGFVPTQSTERITNEQSNNTPPIQDHCRKNLIGLSSVIGRRQYQQDALAVSDLSYAETLKSARFMAILCDGMGGMNGGEKASALCIEKMLEAYSKNTVPYDKFYRENIIEIDRQVADLKDDDGNYLGGGSTLISVVLDGNKLYWGSVGDSHIYIIRNSEMVLVNTEHNYMQELLEQVKRGEITMEQANADKSKDALISYMGMGAVTLMDINERPFELQEGDFVVLCSDGLYRSVSDKEIFDIIKGNSFDMQVAAERLTSTALLKNYAYQDNTSVIVIKYQ